MKKIRLEEIEEEEYYEENIDDSSVYSENGREQLCEEDGLSPTELAFMRGWDDANNDYDED